MNTTDALAECPRVAPPPLTAALLRVQPEDFVVEEVLPWVPEGRGEHLWVQVRKRGFNTDQVAQWLARTAGIPRRDVGYAGMKDRHAVTLQWFSLQLGARPDPVWDGLPANVEIVAAQRHARKLKTGALTGNRFHLVLRECVGDRESLAARCAQLAVDGVPNYFGEQRFGRGAGNIEQARAMFAGAPVRERHLRSLYLSAARSLLFNDILAERVRAGTWAGLLPGEACALAGSRSFFVIDDVDAVLTERLARHDIHPSGALWGQGEPPTRHAVRELELAVAARHADLAAGLAAAGLEQERRPLRLIPEGLAAEWESADLRLRFSLPAGSYATTVLRELADYRDVTRPPEDPAM